MTEVITDSKLYELYVYYLYSGVHSVFQPTFQLAIVAFISLCDHQIEPEFLPKHLASCASDEQIDPCVLPV